MFVAEQQLTSLSPPQKQHSQECFLFCQERFSGICAAGNYVAELSVARSTMRVNSSVPAERRISLSSPLVNNTNEKDIFEFVFFHLEFFSVIYPLSFIN